MVGWVSEFIADCDTPSIDTTRCTVHKMHKVHTVLNVPPIY
jgi:hypothetical protein